MKGARSDKANFLQKIKRAGIGIGATSDRGRSIMKKARVGAANAKKRAKAGRGRQR